MSFPPVETQLELLKRGVEKIVPEVELAQKLAASRQTGTPLRVKYGIDPTAASVHLGHTVPLRKMRQFQDFGHQAVIIIGNATAMVGDPSGRDEARKKQLTPDEVEANAQFYLEQVGKVVDLSQAEIHRNGDWFGKMGLTDILQLCGKVTIAQLLTRDDFAKRMQNESPIFLHECLYPVMQAWDSVMIRSDVELGGTEQLYSFMLARDLQRAQGLPQQVSLMSPILVGTDGTRRMGKSLGNYIGISEEPYEMMKKFMQLPDAVMRMFFELLTSWPLDQVDSQLAGHPKAAKIELARTIISEYHSAQAAQNAIDRWQAEIGEGALPGDIPVAPLSRGMLNESGCLQAAQLLKELKLVPSTSVAMQRIKGGAVFALINAEKRLILDKAEWVPVAEGMIVRAGKKDWCRIALTD